MNTLVSVFNEKGNFAGNIELKEDAGLTKVRETLIPHRVEQTAHEKTNTLTVRPMLGLSVNEEGFLTMIKAQLRNAGLLNMDNILETGYGAFELGARFDQKPNGHEAKIEIHVQGQDRALVQLTLSYDKSNRPGELPDIIREDVNSMVSSGQAIGSLLNQGIEFIVSHLQDMIDTTTAFTELQEVPATPNEHKVERVRAPGAELPNVRKMVDEHLAASRSNPTEPEVSIGYLEVFPGDRSKSIAVLIQLNDSDIERFMSEGVLTTIISYLPQATITDGVLMFESSKGYLLSIRSALSDHGILPISITPRETSSITAEDRASFVTLIN